MQYILNFILFGVLNLVDIWIIIYYQKRIYGNISISKAKFRLLVASIYIILTIFMIDVPSLILWGIVLLSSIWTIAYQSNKNKKILFQLVLISLALLALVITFLLSSILIKDEASVGMILLFIPHAIFGVLVKICTWLNKCTSAKLPLHMWILLSTIPLVSVICVPSLTKILDFVKNDMYVVEKIELPIIFAILFINMMVFYLFDKFSALLNSRLEKALLEQQVVMQKKYYQRMEQNYQRIRTLQHDMKNRIHTITELYENGQHEELHSYLLEANGSLEKADKIIITGNTAIDTVLNFKISELKENLIQVNASILIPKNIKMTFEQSTILLGNLLDNAMEACMLLPAPERNVQIQMRYTDNILYFNISNSMKTTEQTSLLQSTKDDTFLHGIGLKNVRQVIDIFHGTIKLSAKENNFKVAIVLYGV